MDGPLSKTSSNSVYLAWLISDFMNVWNLAKCFATFLHCILLKKWSPKNHIRGGVSEPLNFRFSAVRSREYRFTHMDYSLLDIPFLSEAHSGERIWVISKVANLMVWWLWQEEKEKKEKRLIWRFAKPGNRTLASNMKGESTDRYTKEDCSTFGEIFHYKYYVSESFQFSPLKGP